MDFPQIETHYLVNRNRLVKRITFRVGSSAAAEDIVQTTYERALKYIKTFRGEYFDRWFTTILNNALREYQNTEKGYVYRDDDGDEEVANTIDCPHYPSRVMAEIMQMIDQREGDQQEVLTLYFFNEYTAIDISRITPYSYAKVHQIIQRFRNELKIIYKE